MGNPAVSNVTTPQGANALMAAGPEAGASAGAGDGLFGVLLAKQIALGQPLADAPVADVEPQGAEEADFMAAGTAQQSDPLLLSLLPQATKAVEKTPRLDQQDKPDDVQGGAVGAPVVAGGFVPVVGMNPVLTGKNLPAGTVGQPDVAAIQNSQSHVAEAVIDQLNSDSRSAISPMAGEPEFKAPFEALLADKKAVPVMPDAAGALATPASAAHVQTAPVSPTGSHGVKQPEMTVPQQVGAEGWGAGLGDKVVWMVGNQTRGAEIHLNPPALGPLEVRVNVSDGQANLSFMTHHASVREAIEAATPRLREMLNDSGIGMGSVSVNVGSFSQQQMPSRDPEHAGAGWPSLADESFAVVDTPVAVVRPLHGRGMVDLFA